MIDKTLWNGKRVLITGHTGFKGTWLTLIMKSFGAEVIGYSLAPPTTPSFFELCKIESDITSYRGDIRDFAQLNEVVANEKPDIIFHLAAQPLVRLSYKNPLLTYETNIMGTANLLEAVRMSNTVRAVVVVTTDKCYENKEWLWGYRENEPLGGYDPYSSSKAGAELVCASYRQSFFQGSTDSEERKAAIGSVRAGNVIGGGDWAEDRLIPDIIKSISSGEKVHIRSPKAIRPWQHVLEPLAGYMLLAEKLYNGNQDFAEAWNFGPSETDVKPVKWIVEKLCSLWEGSKGYELDNSSQPHEASYLKLDCSKARTRLSWKPQWTLDVALQRIVEWYQAIEEGADAFSISKQQISEYFNQMELGDSC